MIKLRKVVMEYPGHRALDDLNLNVPAPAVILMASRHRDGRLVGLGARA